MSPSPRQIRLIRTALEKLEGRKLSDDEVFEKYLRLISLVEAKISFYKNNISQKTCQKKIKNK